MGELKLAGERSRLVDWRVQSSGRCPATPPFSTTPNHDSGPGTGFAVAPDSASAIQFLARSDREQQIGRHGFGRLIGVPTRPFPSGRNPVGQCEVPIDLLPPGSRGDSSRRSVQENRNRNRSSRSSPLPLRREPNRRLECRTGYEFPPGTCSAALSHVKARLPGLGQTEQPPP